MAVSHRITTLWRFCTLRYHIFSRSFWGVGLNFYREESVRFFSSEEFRIVCLRVLLKTATVLSYIKKLKTRNGSFSEKKQPKMTYFVYLSRKFIIFKIKICCEVFTQTIFYSFYCLRSGCYFTLKWRKRRIVIKYSLSIDLLFV